MGQSKSNEPSSNQAGGLPPANPGQPVPDGQANPPTVPVDAIPPQGPAPDETALDEITSPASPPAPAGPASAPPSPASAPASPTPAPAVFSGGGPVPAEASAKAPGQLIFSPAAFDDPDSDSDTSQAPAIPEAPPIDPEMEALFITSDRLNSLWNRLDAAKCTVDSRVQSLGIARALLDEIKASRDVLLGGKQNFDQAERFVNEIEYRVGQSERVRHWSNHLGVWLFIYNLVWAGLVGTALFLGVGPNAYASGANIYTYLFTSVLWGALGGVAGALMSLMRHIAVDQDFDRQHTLWYINSPIMGLLIGGVSYLIMQVGVISLMGPSQNIASPIIIYILAWLGGYQHNIFTDTLKRILKVFESGSSS